MQTTYLDRIDIDGEYASAVVCQQRSERSSDHLRSAGSSLVSIHSSEPNRTPVDNGDDSSVSPISIRQDPVVHPRMLEAFHDREGRAWEDGFGRPRWRLIVDRYRDLFCGRDFGLRQEGCGFDVANTTVSFLGIVGEV